MNARTLLVVSWLLCSGSAAHAATNEAIRVFMPDGQIKSHLLRVFITKDLTEADKPELMLLPGRLLLRSGPTWAEKPIQIRELARFQHWTEALDGQTIGFTGTLLIFDMREADFPIFKASMRITPIVKWGDPKETAVAERPVYIGNLIGAGLWTAVVVGTLVGLLYKFTGRSRHGTGNEERDPKPNLKWLLLSPDGRLSLSKTQAAVWTVCIGSVVFCFGLTRFEPPRIPDSLVALMGLSLTTRALCYAQESKKQERNPAPAPDATLKTTVSPALRDLIYSGVNGRPELAITKAQMLFWTSVVVCLFCAKSLLDGVLWEVPWQLVTLMGMSQASYMVPILRPSDGQVQK